MDILEYVSPEKIFGEYAKLYNSTRVIAEATMNLNDAEASLEAEKGAMISDPAFVAEKNQALQDAKWRTLFPAKYAEVKRWKDAIAVERVRSDECRITIDSYHDVMRLFEIVNNKPA